MADIISDIKKALKEEKLVLGKAETIKGLRAGKFSKVYVASNCPDDLRGDIEHLSSLASVDVVDTGIQNDELGDICKKPFSIAIMGLLK